ncbi:MAG: hypothetical protein E7337_05440 [Clostridiales bacterium]|nr:hypothetical protein [Clostridiales bacterium]
MKDRQKVLDALAEAPTITAAARAAGVTRQTVYNLMADDVFRDALKRQREAQSLERAERLSAAREAAIKAVTDVMNSSDVPAAARVMAAKEVLRQATEADAAVDSIFISHDFESKWF